MTDPDAAAAFDRGALERLVRFGGLKLLGGMVDIFEESADARRTALEAALASGDGDAIRLTLHALKSSAAQLGAMRLSESCRRGEESLAGGGDTGVAAQPPHQLVKQIERELDESIVWIRRVRQEMEGANAGPADDRGH